MTQPDLAEVIDRYHKAVGAMITGDPEPQKLLWSRADDATLANPLGPAARGWDDISHALGRAAAMLRDGTFSAIERVSDYATADLAYIVEIERTTVRVGDAPAPADVALRVTTIFRREVDGWKIVHRHADPITGARPVESLFGQ
jgi:ketosteroid isomerase-like protein